MTVGELRDALSRYRAEDVVLGIAIGKADTWKAFEVDVQHDNPQSLGMPVVVLRAEPDWTRFRTGA
jgi:hypothetical protein